MSLIETQQEQIQNDCDSHGSEIPEFLRQDFANYESDTDELKQKESLINTLNCKNIMNSLLGKLNLNQSGDGPFINETNNNTLLIANKDDSDIILEQSDTHIVDLNDFIDKDRKKKNVIDEMKNRFSPKSDTLLNESSKSESVSSIYEEHEQEKDEYEEELITKQVDIEVKKSTDKPKRPPPPLTTTTHSNQQPTAMGNRCTRKCSIQFFDIKSKIQQFEKINSIKQTESQKSILADDCTQTAIKVKDLKNIFEQ
jgi:hypothetical protein